MDQTSDTSSLVKGPQPGPTILIVEDEPLMLRLLLKFFSRHGYHVLEASDGEQAMEVYRRQKLEIDAVLLDRRLPRSTGDQVFQLMKAENAGVKVVMASGYLEPEVKAELARAGVRQFVSKPYSLKELLTVFERLL
jgi:DNA-binding response OmpR family regulator